GGVAGTIPDDADIVLFLHESMAGIPIAALVADDGSYLSERHNLWLASGALLRKSEVLISRKSAALAVATASAGRTWSEWLPPLPEAEREAVEVAEHFANPTLLTSADATVDAVVRALPKADLFH